LYRARLPFPIEVVKDVALPEHCSPSTLVICSSFSGHTFETLSCFEDAMARGCRTVAVCAGGELRGRGEDSGVPVLVIPGDPPAPRAALGLLLLSTLGALEAMGLVPALSVEVDATARTLEETAASVGPGSPEEANPAKRLARRIGERMPVIWGAEGIGAVAASRWRAEMLENAKTPAFAASFPELDHNEIVPWGEGRAELSERFSIVTLRHDGERPEIAERIADPSGVASDGGLDTVEVRAQGESPLARFMSLALVGGATSVYLALLRGVDPAPIAAIERLKRERAERARNR
jgi:glucose/mannose-6-phosphate isomerase